jgi:mono/diheme cytochrome c family protein
MTRIPAVLLACGVAGCLSGKGKHIERAETNPAVAEREGRAGGFDDDIDDHANKLREEGRKIFRFDTFGDEVFWGDELRLHEAVERLTPKDALALGLKVDSGALGKILVEAIKGGRVSLEKPGTTIELLKANSVVGVKAFFDDKGKLRSIGITCALCHSTVDDSFASGIGRRLDGWPNRDLDVGAIVAQAPNLKPFTTALGIDELALKKVLTSWGPGRYDAEVIQDGKATRPDGKTGATLLPAAFGLAGVNLHTYNGWGSVTYWNAYVAVTQMHGQGTFFDPRLADRTQFPVVERTGFDDVRPKGEDKVTSKLAALHYYQLSIPAPKPREGTFDASAAKRGEAVFKGKARCATCHVPPLFAEPGWPMHAASEIGVDTFQSSRSPDRKFYRTTPLRGLFVRTKGGFYHDGRFADLEAVVGHYDRHLKLGLADDERRDLVEYLKSL